MDLCGCCGGFGCGCGDSHRGAIRRLLIVGADLSIYLSRV